MTIRKSRSSREKAEDLLRLRTQSEAVAGAMAAVDGYLAELGEVWGSEAVPRDVVVDQLRDRLRSLDVTDRPEYQYEIRQGRLF